MKPEFRMNSDEDDGVEEAWDKELSRRVTDIRNGTTSSKPAEQLFTELREEHNT